MSADEKSRMWLSQNGPVKQTPAGGLDPIAVALTVQISIYLVLSLRLLLAHSARVKENFSSVERISLSWLRDLIVACAVLWVLYAFMNLFSPSLGVLRETNYIVSLAMYRIDLETGGQRSSLKEKSVFGGYAGVRIPFAGGMFANIEGQVHGGGEIAVSVGKSF